MLAEGSIVSLCRNCHKKASAEHPSDTDVNSNGEEVTQSREEEEKVFHLKNLFAKEAIINKIRPSFVGQGSSRSDDGTDTYPSNWDSNSDLLRMMYMAMFRTPSQKPQQKSISDIVATIRDRSQQDGVVEDRQSSVIDILNMLDQYQGELKGVLDKYAKNLDLTRLCAPAFLYYLEHEDEVKNPSWKRRVHRFFPGIGSTQMDQLNSALQLSALSYADSLPEIEDGLEMLDPNYRIVACSLSSEPGKPAHFLAIHNSNHSEGTFLFGKRLRAILVVRGSKSMADTLTDIICEPVPYRGGKAHSFILESGRFIANKNRDILIELAHSAGLSSSKIDLTIIGHSLGAGAATISAMEMRNDPMFDVKVVGFGGPAILTKELAKETSSYVTSVINNDDVVPRMSGASVANVLARILEFNWINYAEHDITQAFEEISEGLPLSVSVKQSILENIRPLLESVASNVNEDRKKLEPLPIELFPAGKCIHLYRDGVGISGCFVPNTFFKEIDVSRTMVSGKFVPVQFGDELIGADNRSHLTYWL